jgi:uncharacterized phage infection (PIP) family protein YhgE
VGADAGVDAGVDAGAGTGASLTTGTAAGALAATAAGVDDDDRTTRTAGSDALADGMAMLTMGGRLLDRGSARLATGCTLTPSSLEASATTESERDAG